ncbi:MAG: TetR/AcrR family transcriptional regulator, partial [Calditrichaceae bacterium]
MESSKTRKRILYSASKKFFKYGFYKVSMDSLVAELRTSKSTIYKYFPTKEDLVKAVLEEINSEINTNLESIIVDTTKNFQEKLIAITQFTGKILIKVSQEFLTDLHRQTPDLWEYYQTMRLNRLENLYGRLFKNGVVEGIIRQDVHLDFLLLIYTKLTELTVEPDALST